MLETLTMVGNLAPSILLQALALSIIAGVAYAIIGIIPGTDETATQAPILLMLALLGFHPCVLVAWAVSATVSMHITHTIPTAMVGLPGSVGSVGMVYDCNRMKILGVPHVSMRRQAAASVFGLLICVPAAFLFAFLLAPLGPIIAKYTGLIFTIGACLLAYMSSGKIGSIIAIIPFSFFCQGLQQISLAKTGATVSIIYFMAITIGPLVNEIWSTMVPSRSEKLRRSERHKLVLNKDPEASKTGLFPNPLKYLTKRQRRRVAISSAIGGCAFFLSQGGTTILLGETVGQTGHGTYDRAMNSLAVRAAAANATYLGALIIPLVAFGLPVSPMALGPAAALFNAPPRFTLEPMYNCHTLLGTLDFIVYVVIGCIGAILIAYPVSMKYARAITKWVFTHISNEALIGTFLGLIVMISYYEGGVIGVFIAFTVAFVGGILHNDYGCNVGVQFMAFFASSWIVGLIH